jgi:beta-lactamase regulating signal transducer with metallopeptidase domain
MNITDALGWSLLHFVWQGILIALVLSGVLALLRNARPHVRYAANCAALLAMPLCALATFAAFAYPGTAYQHSAPGSWPLGLSSEVTRVTGISSPRALADYIPALVWTWIAGVLLSTLRSVGGWAMAERFARRQTRPADDTWNERFAALTRRLAIAGPVRLAISSLAQVPAVVGCLRPVVLLPASVLTGLTAEQIEALLVHELAHIRRHDYLVNLLQTVVETLFFYHPAVWWINRNIRSEREDCCDDLAVELCGNPLTYVRALTALEQTRLGAPRLAMAADGGGLLRRVQRLLGASHTPRTTPTAWIAGIGVLACLLIAGVSGRGLAQHPAPSGAAPQADAAEAAEAAPQAAQAAPQPQSEKAPAPVWLDGIEAEGFRNLDVDKLIALKIHGVDGAYIRQIRAAGQQPTADQLIAFRIHGVTADFINGMKAAGLANLKPDELVALRIHGADPAFVQQVQALGYKNLTVDEVVALRIHGVTADFMRSAVKRFQDLSLKKLVQLKQFGIFE